MEFDTKIKVILREGLEPWQELNVTAFLISGIAGTQHIVGDAYVDADGMKYLPMSQQPIVILSAGPEKLSEVMQKSDGKGHGGIHLYKRTLFHLQRCGQSGADHEAPHVGARPRRRCDSRGEEPP